MNGKRNKKKQSLVAGLTGRDLTVYMCIRDLTVYICVIDLTVYMC